MAAGNRVCWILLEWDIDIPETVRGGSFIEGRTIKRDAEGITARAKGIELDVHLGRRGRLGEGVFDPCVLPGCPSLDHEVVSLSSWLSIALSALLPAVALAMANEIRVGWIEDPEGVGPRSR